MYRYSMYSFSSMQERVVVSGNISGYLFVQILIHKKCNLMKAFYKFLSSLKLEQYIIFTPLSPIIQKKKQISQFYFCITIVFMHKFIQPTKINIHGHWTQIHIKHNILMHNICTIQNNYKQKKKKFYNRINIDYLTKNFHQSQIYSGFKSLIENKNIFCYFL